jgi:hypothetical protein
MVLPFFFPATLVVNCRGLEEGEEPSGGNALRLIQIRLSDAEFGKISLTCRDKFAATANHRFQLEKSTQLFIRTHNETFSVVAN